MSSIGQSDPPQTVRIAARRFAQSPYYNCYVKPETVLGVAAGRYYDAFNGEDSIEIYWKLRKQSVLYDVPEKPWQIEGPDAVPFLEKIFARRIGDLREGRGRYAIACTPDGGIFMDGILFKIGEDRFCYVQPDGELELWLIAHSHGFEVKISDPNSRVLQIQGPNSMKVMAEATDGAIDESMRYFHSGYYSIGGQVLYVSRTGWTGELGYEVYSQGAATDHIRLWNHLMNAGSAHGMVYGCMASMGMRRIEAGILDNISDIDQSMTPFEAGLGSFIELDKTGFIGREALLDADRRPLLLGLRCESLTPQHGDEIRDGSVAVGRVKAAAWSPTLDCGIGYVRFDRAQDWIGRTLDLVTGVGEIAPCEIVELPFYDSARRLPRGNGDSLP